jgi:hypothetical protein
MRAQNNVIRPHNPKRVRYVYDESAREIGGAPVQTEADSGLLTVELNDAEAQYYLDQGVIGNKPFDTLKKQAINVVEQVTGTSDVGEAPVPKKSR